MIPSLITYVETLLLVIAAILSTATLVFIIASVVAAILSTICDMFDR